MPQWTPDIIKKKLTSTVQGLRDAVGYSKIREQVNLPGLMERPERDPGIYPEKIGLQPAWEGWKAKPVAEKFFDVADIAQPGPEDIGKLALKLGAKSTISKVPIAAAITVPTWRKALSDTLNLWINKFAKNKATEEELSAISKAVVGMTDVPEHLLKDITKVEPRAYGLPQGIGGMFSPIGSGGALEWKGAMASPTTPPHELGHYLQQKLRELVGDKASEELAFGHKGNYIKLNTILSQNREQTYAARYALQQYRDKINEAYKSNFLSRDQWVNLYQRYIDLYHKIPTEEALVENFGKSLAQGDNVVDAFKKANKLALRVRDTQRRLMDIVRQRTGELGTTITNKKQAQVWARRLEAHAVDFENELANFGPGLKPVMPKKDLLIEDLGKALVARGLNPKEALELAESYKTLPTESVRRLWEKYGGRDILPGKAPAGKYVKTAEGVKWVGPDIVKGATGGM